MCQPATKRSYPVPDDRGPEGSRLSVVRPPVVDDCEGTAPLEPTEGLFAELSGASARLEGSSPEAILRWTVDRFAPRFTMATAFGPEGMVLIHMLAEVGPRTPIFNLDTGYQFSETLAMVDRVRARYGIEVAFVRPPTTVEEYEAAHGGPVYRARPDQCCWDRKVSVLHEGVRGMHAWASAIRRDQSSDRARAAIAHWDAKFRLVKVSPLANWTKTDVWQYITRNDIPYNPLHDQGYASIGCRPCTRAILYGEDERAGRWSGSQKTECGLHTLDAPSK
ncbi:MAG: phosphoadenylyl-sulfate reductase [Planctomycetes bacterium]|nr:phosphoadenylyl-sulfate reductase [Planctomycetota bacterium]